MSDTVRKEGGLIVDPYWKERLKVEGVILPLAEAAGFCDLLSHAVVVRHRDDNGSLVRLGAKGVGGRVSMTGVLSSYGDMVGELRFAGRVEAVKVGFTVMNTETMNLPENEIGDLCDHLENNFPRWRGVNGSLRPEVVEEWRQTLGGFATVCDRIEQKQPLVIFTGDRANLAYLKWLGVERSRVGEIGLAALTKMRYWRQPEIQVRRLKN